MDPCPKPEHDAGPEDGSSLRGDPQARCWAAGGLRGWRRAALQLRLRPRVVRGTWLLTSTKGRPAPTCRHRPPSQPALSSLSCQASAPGLLGFAKKTRLEGPTTGCPVARAKASCNRPRCSQLRKAPISQSGGPLNFHHSRRVLGGL
jgi:hypothetical protein